MVYGDLNLNLNDHPNSFNSNLSSSSTSISGLSRVDSSWAYPYSYNSNSVPHLYRADERKPGMKDMDVGNNSKSSTSGQEGYSQVVQATPSTRPRARKRAFHSSMDVDNDRNNTNITTNRKRTRGEHDYDGDAADTRPTARLSRHVSQSTAGPSSKADTVPVERIPKTPVPIRNPNSNPKLPSRTTKLKPSNPNLHVRASRTTEDLQPNEALTAVKPALYSHQPEVPKVIPVSDMGNDTRFRGRGRGTGVDSGFVEGVKLATTGTNIGVRNRLEWELRTVMDFSVMTQRLLLLLLLAPLCLLDPLRRHHIVSLPP
ncbi:hypothetical protein BDP27DRAFT_1365386 [Rhodocollybia butyracea]|uniref:Uncharacterized protein n=1 Tax=Rhodocollybia butyracea TaxID=206335 RepID=A0A9P5PJL1_9AGAR|nr:hypothetical protein BDP27DRAFT_1365386 [Rhodocollybia butyracea]